MTPPDIIIVGGGIAGASCALALARGGMPVSLVEAEPAAQWKIGETLGPESRPVLQALGVWDRFTQAGHLPCHGNASAWGGGALVAKDFIFNPYGNAWQLDRVSVETMLVTAAEQAGAVIRRGHAVDEIERHATGWYVHLGAETLSAKGLVDATGRRSAIARKAGVKREILDQLVAVYRVASSDSGSDQDSRTYIESCPDGWWYSALMPGGRRTLSFQTDADLLPGQDWRTSEWFTARLRQTCHISKLLEGHGYAFHGLPQLTSAHSGRLEQAAGDGWLAVGDAAISFDPLSGHGIINALTSGQKAAALLLSAEPNSAVGASVYTDGTETTWQRFLEGRKQYYKAENRWPTSEFWRRRH
ncbi:MAG TPA: NAD(P)/FAD-dependent oxidoreductase [Candidatus Limnocylindria bacterium]|nr:NAD(P)/FAD-dependent oxidoreductase [Candidatus Limnocylindria bacterium]